MNKEKAQVLAQAQDKEDKERKAKTVGAATLDDLAAEMIDRSDLTDEWLIERFAIELEEEHSPFEGHESEIRDIYTAIAEGKNEQALRLIYDLASNDVTLLHPKSQLRLSQERV